MFFKGYVRTKDKKCAEKFKNRTDFSTYDQIKDLDEFAGILSADTILIDIDDQEQSEIMMKMVEDNDILCRVYETTRGKHFLFKNSTVDKCFTHTKLACGLTADIKVGVKNSYEVLKFNGVERPVIYDVVEGEEYQTIPTWMLPVKTSADFIGMDAGDGRNQALFNYILSLQSNGYGVEEARDCIRLINKYVLKDPLSDQELEVILRDEAFQQPVFYDGRKFLHDQFGNYLINTKHIIRLDGELHIYKDGIYVSDLREIEAAMIRLIPTIQRSKRQEVLSYIDVMANTEKTAASSDWIAFKNGVYNVKTDEFKEFTPDLIITNKIPWDYNPAADHELTDIIIENVACGDEEVMDLLEEMVGYCMYRRNELGKAFILTGSGSNGKSTFLNMLRRMLGRENISVLDLKQLSDRFSTVMMYQKLANIGDDISDEFVSDTSEFKKIVTGESISAEQKGQPKFNFDPYCKLLFSSNNIPRLGKGKDSKAIMRRLVIIPFNARFDKSDPNFRPFIGDDLKSAEAMEYLIQIGLYGLKRVLRERSFTEPATVQKELVEYERENNPVMRFIDEMEADNWFVDGKSTGEVYSRYCEFCVSENLQPISKIAFSKQLAKQFGYVIKDQKINGKKFRIYVKG